MILLDRQPVPVTPATEWGFSRPTPVGGGASTIFLRPPARYFVDEQRSGYVLNERHRTSNDSAGGYLGRSPRLSRGI